MYIFFISAQSLSRMEVERVARQIQRCERFVLDGALEQQSPALVAKSVEP